ncbi:rhomboid family intramembrane serine protease [Halovivax cerinus]|uniref:Rhomboid family intramembrane serine protease n=1 Tax=Halovivax cerinus TaxID=1487865 RepID=A0ABD5NSE2_9EURY|nr:rhomboid family intramembrane serine protease [Halovivax cerinus]
MRWTTAVTVLSLVVLVTLAIRGVDHLDGETDWHQRARDRLYLGVPWGTLVVVGIVLFVYFVVQDGLTEPTDPVSIPYRAWSYRYPLGMVTAPFAHASLGHLLGNLTGALVLAPIAEYAWGHYPGHSTDGSASIRADPRVRAVVVFPLGVCLVALATSVLAVGPVIGFSGVVFAFAGFAMVSYPIHTVVASLGAHGALLTVIRAMRSPVTVAGVDAAPPAPPGWATIAIQAHALGFLAGVLLALAVSSRARGRPRPGRFWIAVVLFAFGKSMWAIYWYGAEGRYVLFRAPGVALVLVLSIVVTLAVTDSERPLIGDTTVTGTDRDRATPERTGYTHRVRRIFDVGRRAVRSTAISAGFAGRIDSLPRRETATVALVVVLALVSGPALALNAVSPAPSDTQPALSVDGYGVTYDESVEHELVSVVPVDAYGSTESVTVSGVIVWSTERSLWTNAVSANRLAHSGSASVELGAPGWRRTVSVERTGWDVVGNESTYQVWLDSPSADRSLAFESPPRRSSVAVDGVSMTLASVDGTFVLHMAGENESSETVPVPAADDRSTNGDITLVHEDDRLVAVSDGTRAVVAIREYDE